jgi:2-polyprenyl-3-methyl-5-hydroxy-6-metoxy-1,4-benzoquinol methylase
MGTEFNIEQFDSIYPKGIENHYWNSAKNRIVEDVLSKYRTTANILEVGCGRGVVIKYLLDRGYRIRGVDLAQIPVDLELNEIIKTGIDVFSLDPIEYRDVDTILLCDVIEHLEFPELFLLRLKQTFPHLRRFIITVPARQEIFSNYDEFNGHFRRYSRTTLLQDFSKIDGKVNKLTYTYHGLYIPARLLLKSKGQRETNIKAPSGVLQKLVHRILSNYFLLEYMLLPGRWKGTSLLLEFELV